MPKFKCLRKQELDGLLVLAVRNDYTYFKDEENRIEIYFSMWPSERQNWEIIQIYLKQKREPTNDPLDQEILKSIEDFFDDRYKLSIEDFLECKKQEFVDELSEYRKMPSKDYFPDVAIELRKKVWKDGENIFFSTKDLEKLMDICIRFRDAVLEGNTGSFYFFKRDTKNLLEELLKEELRFVKYATVFVEDEPLFGLKRSMVGRIIYQCSPKVRKRQTGNPKKS